LLKKKMSLLDPSNPIPDVIVEEARRLDNIITDFLNYARPRTPHFVPCDIRDIIDKNITFLLTDSRLDNFTLRKEAPENLPEVSADPDMLYQAFLNILINAVQAMPDGGEIRIALNSASDQVTIFFDDQGHGVSEDIAEKIWDPFVTTKETGTGLGLSIVKKIIESHCGKIRIENLPGGGARVAIELPVKQESSDHGHHSDR
jgi:signal transduction histidine kinase